MRIKTEITEQDLKRLLVWLADDEHESARKYETLRAGLVRYFEFRGCSDADTLADETINRVAVKLAVVEFDGKVKVSSYFYAFASRIHLEYLREAKKIRDRAEQVARLYDAPDEAVERAEFACLDKCLGRLSVTDRRILLSYYDADRSKAERRRKIAESEGISIEALHTRVSRQRSMIGSCVKVCMGSDN